MYTTIVTGLVLLFVIFAITTHKVPVIAVGILIPFLLSVTGVIPASTAFQGLGSTTTFLIVGALAIGDACFRTGLTDSIGIHVIRYTGKFQNESVKLLLISLLAAVLSAFLSSFGVQVALLSLIMVMAQVLRISKTRSLLALGYSATVGGTWSIVGTTLMVMAKSAYEAAVPGETIGMFEITKASLPVGLAAILVYCFLTSRYQPDRCGGQDTGQEKRGTAQKAAKEAEQMYTRRDRRIVGLVFLAFILLVALDGKTPIPANMATVLVLLAFGATGISTVYDMVQCISWDAIFFITGLTVLSGAMTSSGLSEIIGKILLFALGGHRNPYLIVGIICVVCAVLTQLMSNSGAFAVVLPFLSVIADSFGVALKPLIVAATIACSCGFCMPLAAPSYFMLAEEGNIQVSDWLKQGMPILAVCLGLTILLVPWLWPLY